MKNYAFLAFFKQDIFFHLPNAFFCITIVVARVIFTTPITSFFGEPPTMSIDSKTIATCAEALSMAHPSYVTHDGVGEGLKQGLSCFIRLVRQAMYPEVYGGGNGRCQNRADCVSECLTAAAERLFSLCEVVLSSQENQEGHTPDHVVRLFFERLPEVAEQLKEDIAAAYMGDPAARSEEEIVCAYPSFEAMSIFRMAHLLYKLNVPLLPRMMTEYAHKTTGIDIHPGATIGRGFFIDHGTGVVIGETCVIGDYVKLYQGVTLGAKSFPKNSEGQIIKGIQRHPRIGNRVVIYAGATILGGDTVIGDDAVIGGNVWLTHSVPEGAIVTNNGIKLPSEK